VRGILSKQTSSRLKFDKVFLGFTAEQNEVDINHLMMRLTLEGVGRTLTIAKIVRTKVEKRLMIQRGHKLGALPRTKKEYTLLGNGWMQIFGSSATQGNHRGHPSSRVIWTDIIF
jgi:hypothetical protein